MMTQFVLGVLCGFSIVFIYASIQEVEERKTKAELEKFEKWRNRLP